MNCQTAATKMQELLDGVLSASLGAQVHEHLDACPACLKQYRRLESMAEALVELPYYRPSANFNANVLAAVGRMKRAQPRSSWMTWAISAFVSLETAWVAALVFISLSRLSLLRVLHGIDALRHPAQLRLVLEYHIAQASLTLMHAFAAISEQLAWRPPVITLESLLRLGGATILAGGVMIALSRSTAPAVNVKIGGSHD